ncbi:hypothetical protein SEVIR_8G037050v4 [Setaria viridis]
MDLSCNERLDERTRAPPREEGGAWPPCPPCCARTLGHQSLEVIILVCHVHGGLGGGGPVYLGVRDAALILPPCLFFFVHVSTEGGENFAVELPWFFYLPLLLEPLVRGKEIDEESARTGRRVRLIAQLCCIAYALFVSFGPES